MRKNYMNKIIAIIASLMLTTSAFAGSYGVGVSGSVFNISADVKEVTSSSDTYSGSDTHTGTVENDLVPIPAIFAEYNTDYFGITVGLEYIPGSADISKNMQSRTETPASGTNESTATNYKANASVEDIYTVYVEVPMGSNGLYVRGGMMELDVITDESGVQSYGNATADGITYGIGWKSGTDAGLNYKLSYEVIDLDTVSITGASSHTVSGDIDTAGVKFSLAYNF